MNSKCSRSHYNFAHSSPVNGIIILQAKFVRVRMSDIFFKAFQILLNHQHKKRREIDCLGLSRLTGFLSGLVRQSQGQFFRRRNLPLPNRHHSIFACLRLFSQDEPFFLEYSCRRSDLLYQVVVSICFINLDMYLLHIFLLSLLWWCRYQSLCQYFLQL